MTQNIIPFAFKGHEIRTALIDGEPAFVGKDVCDRLGYADPTNAMKLHCKGVVKRHPLQTPGGTQNVRILFEPDVLRLIIKSRLPEAEEFERWVFEEVLPSIRKTGSYSAKPLVPQTYAEALLEAGRIAKERDALKVENKELAVKGAALDRISTATGTHGLYEAAKILQVGPKKFVMWLASNQWIYKRTGSKVWLARQEKINAGYLWHKVDTFTDANGEERTRDTVKVLPKGLEKLAKVAPGAHLDADYAAVLEAAMRPFAKKQETATV